VAPPAVFVRADANRNIGWGHVVRSAALAEALREGGCSLTWLVSESDDQAVEYLMKRFRVVRIGRKPAEAQPAGLGEGSWLVVDSYGWRARDHLFFRSRGVRVLALDDAGTGSFAPDLLLNPSPGAECLHYHLPAETRLLLGPRYALLRREFREGRPRRIPPAPVRRLLVTFGGGDPLGITSRLCRVLRSVAPEVELRVVVGPSGRAIRGPGIIRGASSAEMRRIMETSDAAVVSPSSVLWELARVGVPAAVLGYAQNQRLVERSLRRRGAVFPLGWYERVGDATLARRLRAFLADTDLRLRLMRRLSSQVDGRGISRVIKAMGL
jgi:UDP-2,4-diacetamido-2,4,6-trideoxy-beta-L-altropyranose hydrolase